MIEQKISVIVPFFNSELTLYKCLKSIFQSDYKNFEVIAEINSISRHNTKLNHTATHLLHKALKSNLGDHVQQAGSLVSPDKLRFDLTHFEQIPQDIIEKIEIEVNEEILKNTQLNIEETSFDKALMLGKNDAIF